MIKAALSTLAIALLAAKGSKADNGTNHTMLHSPFCYNAS